ncbi:hypothetical protein L3V77_07520 [Vibrio sp. DW001]|uniref:hypothetical protein n=1 Tax=Vibrio sp. DW001 TaxID=2912315 RepID=UPI0023AE9243|nr:hypothetical protein [Vibrio sp. DW001]WED28068.1 hypothetical protein L3V77_07520 [Vibrio sp. DW001]
MATLGLIAALDLTLSEEFVVSTEAISLMLNMTTAMTSSISVISETERFSIFTSMNGVIWQ